MKLSLKNKIFISFIVVIVLTSSFTTFVGIKLIGESIVPRVQDHAKLDLNSAREIFHESIDQVKNIVRFTAVRFFIRDALISGDVKILTERLEQVRRHESLDFLSITNAHGYIIMRSQNPAVSADKLASTILIDQVLKEKQVLASTEYLSHEDLLRESDTLANKAFMKLTPTPHTISPDTVEETSGLVIMAASPIVDENGIALGVLYGGKLLNHNYSIVDVIRDTVYELEKFHGKDVGVVTVFLKDIRISTTMKDEDGNRAVGTIVSEEVERHVLSEGKTWIERAFVVDDWYITAYEPVYNISGDIIGMLGLGLLESRYGSMQMNALWIFIGITLGGIGLSLIVCVLLTNSIMKPINTLLVATRRFAEGNLDEKVELENAPKEIDGLVKAFNFMTDSIRERDKMLRKRAQEEIRKSERLAMIGQLAAGVAHEINNPLGGILLFSRLLLRKAPDEGLMRENLERIEKDAKRCQNIVQGLLDFARQRDPKMESVNLNDMVERAISLFENQALFLNIEVVKDYRRDLPPVFIDPAQIQQVFVNIIMNAADAMEGNGTLILRTGLSDDGFIVADFTDSGNGIPPDQIDRVFEPFFTTKGVGHGTGLGLSISYGIVQRHGGTIRVESTVEEGSMFEVMLPAAEEE